MPADEQAFEQLVTRFEKFLKIRETSSLPEQKEFGIMIHDNNQTVAKRHTEMMKHFHNKGTFWTKIKHIIETPLFVDSQLTSIVQIADVCAYTLRRFLENDEDELFNHIYKRADRKGDVVVGVRHFTENDCKCIICENHTA